MCKFLSACDKKRFVYVRLSWGITNRGVILPFSLSRRNYVVDLDAIDNSRLGKSKKCHTENVNCLRRFLLTLEN